LRRLFFRGNSAGNNFGRLAQRLRVSGVRSLTASHFSRVDFELRIMPSRRYRKNAEECLDRAAGARKSEDVDAWLLIAEEWLRLAVELDAAKQQSGRSPQR
jgi:hypothetical protein